jgi:hypothetical protein
MNRKKLLWSIGLKFFGVAAGLVGVLFSIGASGSSLGGLVSLLFFTLQSNIWIMVIMSLFACNDIHRLRRGRGFLNQKWFRVKYVFTVSVMLTFLVFGLLLFPVLPLDYSLSVTSIALHLVAPAVALVDYALYDHGPKIERSDVWMTLLPPLYYVLFVVVCNLIGVRFPPDGAAAPYFFMDYEKYGWFRIDQNGIGVFYWSLLLILFVLLIAFLLRALGIAVDRKTAATGPQNEENC